MSLLWRNGNIVSDSPVFSAADRIRLGDGVFDTMLIKRARAIQPQAHFERLIRHAAVLGIEIPYSIAALAKAASDLCARTALLPGHDYALNTIASRGMAEGGLAPGKTAPNIVMRLRDAPKAPKTLSVVIAKTVRRNEGSPLSQVKSCSYGDNIVAAREAVQKGADEAIMLNNRGQVVCAAAGNVFVVRGDRLYTPPLADGCIDGILRGAIIAKLGAREESLAPEDLKNAEGIYITNNVRGAVAVTMLDSQKIPAPSLQIDHDFHVR